MKLMRMFSLPALLLAIAAPAMAQSAQAVQINQQTAWRPVGVYVAATGGALFDPQTAPAFGAEFGDRIHNNVVAYATFSYFEDLMDQTVSDQLVNVSQVLTSRTGRTWILEGRDRGIGFIAGAKYLFGNGSFRPYLGGGAGALGVHRTISDPRVGDVTEATFDEFNVGAATLTSNTVTRPMLEGAFGVDLDFGRTHAELGYRYRHAYHLPTPPFSQVVAAIGVNF